MRRSCLSFCMSVCLYVSIFLDFSFPMSKLKSRGAKSRHGVLKEIKDSQDDSRGVHVERNQEVFSGVGFFKEIESNL